MSFSQSFHWPILKNPAGPMQLRPAANLNFIGACGSTTLGMVEDTVARAACAPGMQCNQLLITGISYPCRLPSLPSVSCLPASQRARPILKILVGFTIFPTASRKVSSHNGLEPTIRADRMQSSAWSRSNEALNRLCIAAHPNDNDHCVMADLQVLKCF
ncbi:hypothetical protein B0H11DRAFT_2221202 [Mycena galericulata]|nr:hypothetical protein B0H11DRAFT_2221202 [Mycena galericulata]